MELVAEFEGVGHGGPTETLIASQLRCGLSSKRRNRRFRKRAT